MGIEYKSNTPQVKFETSAQISLLIRLMIEDVHLKSVYKTPFRHGDLRAMVGKQMNGKTGIIEWRAPYAEYQERGMRRDGSRVVRNYTTPGTHAHFAEESVKEVMNNVQEYITKAGIQ